MKEWKCKQVIDFDNLTTTVKEERNKTLLHQMKLSSIKFLIWLHYFDLKEWIHSRLGSYPISKWLHCFKWEQDR